MIDRGKHDILGIQIDAVNYEAAVNRICTAAANKKPLAVSALAVHGVMTGVQDRVHRYRLNQFEMIVPDGQPVRWALNWIHGTHLPDRVYGPNLMLKTCAAAAEQGLRVYLFGGTEGTLTALQNNLKEKYPQLQIAGAKASRFRQLTPEERDETVADIQASGAHITLVGLGCPRQEVWAYEFREALSMPVLAVGAAFNFHAGLLPQAPAWMQDRGLEWLYRFIQEPGRLWRRYLLLNPQYATLVLLQYLKLKRLDPKDAEKPKVELLYG